jgi:hypothetical protein
MKAKNHQMMWQMFSIALLWRRLVIHRKTMLKAEKMKRIKVVSETALQAILWQERTFTTAGIAMKSSRCCCSRDYERIFMSLAIFDCIKE